jgi:hypothetical protein
VGGEQRGPEPAWSPLGASAVESDAWVVPLWWVVCSVPTGHSCKPSMNAILAGCSGPAGGLGVAAAAPTAKLELFARAVSAD